MRIKKAREVVAALEAFLDSLSPTFEQTKNYSTRERHRETARRRLVAALCDNALKVTFDDGLRAIRRAS